MSETSMTDRLRRLEDESAIRKLASRYSLAVDDRAFDDLAALWADDAIYGWKGQADPTVGAAAVAELLRGRIGPLGPTFHVNHDHIVDFDDGDPDRATGVVFCHTETTVGGVHYMAAIRYYDRYLRGGAGWLFQERALAFLYFVPASDYPGITTHRDRLRLPGGAQVAHWPDF